MKAFLVRVELHEASYQDYVNLHGHMTQEAFTNMIKSGDGTWYKLPPAEYHLAADCTAEEALEKARRAAQKTGRTFAIVISEYNRAVWTGLVKIDQRAAG